MRDELILALDLYRQEGSKPSLSQLDELSSLLRSIPIEPQLADSPSFRGRDSVYLKLANFIALDPATGTKGMTRGGLGDEHVWKEFSADPERLALAAKAIRANLPDLSIADAEFEEEGIHEASEGKVLTRVHRIRERNRRLVKRKKDAALALTGKLECAACQFDFAAVYGEHGDGFIECHHTTPLAELMPGTKTRLADLELICPNCHRMVHRRPRWLTLEELRSLLAHHA
jgi:5-methylcytosine-specific restriction enzyme A